MLYAAAVLLCLTVLPFLIGFLKGLAGNPRRLDIEVTKESCKRRTVDPEQEYWNAYWAGVLLETPYEE